MYTRLCLFMVIIYNVFVEALESMTAMSCRERSSHLRQDGGSCFEIAPWQHAPVELDQHLDRVRERWGNLNVAPPGVKGKMHHGLINTEISRYMDTVVAPFLDTYHRNIQSYYQQLTSKILKRIKEEMNTAVLKKNQIYANLTKIADELNVPAMCDEERRSTRNIASQHVAQMYACTEEARASIAKMGRYAEEMISITRKHMKITLDEVTRSIEFTEPNNVNVSLVLTDLSRAAVVLGYELDLSLTNARRHNEQSCEKLSTCATHAIHHTETEVSTLEELLYQCVYA